MSVNSARQTVVVFSGGLDSTTLLYHLAKAGHELKALTVNYCQRHDKEIEFARATCAELDIEHRIVELPGLSAIIGDNALMNENMDLPAGAYQDGTIQVTTVPNRNMILLSVAMGWAASLKFNGVAFGAHAGEHTNYPDCKPPFAQAMHEVGQVCDWTPIAVHAPFIDWTKTQIVRRGLELGVPFHQTWSCYAGGEIHCGKCSTCIDRRSAFLACGAQDPVRYAE